MIELTDDEIRIFWIYYRDTNKDPRKTSILAGISINELFTILDCIDDKLRSQARRSLRLTRSYGSSLHRKQKPDSV